MKDNTKMLNNEMHISVLYAANLLFQGLHGCVLYALSLLPDPLRFIRDQECQNDFNYDEHMLQNHTKVKMSEENSQM